MSKTDKLNAGNQTISFSFAALAFMLSAGDELRAPSEHSGLAQNCNDDSRHRAMIESGCESSCDFALSSYLPQQLKNTGVIWGEQVQSMHCNVLNTQNLVFFKSLLAVTGMNKNPYSACIESLAIPYRVMFLHLISTSIRAVDDLQSS
jgi:hypothetical protein